MKVNELTTSQVEQIIADKAEAVILVDVREQEEVEQGIIQEAIHIPLGEIPEAYKEFDQEKHYIIVCRSGNRSNKAAEFLQEQGIKVSNMVGGMLDWQGEVKK